MNKVLHVQYIDRGSWRKWKLRVWIAKNWNPPNEPYHIVPCDVHEYYGTREAIIGLQHVFEQIKDKQERVKK